MGISKEEKKNMILAFVAKRELRAKDTHLIR
jgi:hypothetical protein